MGIKLENSSEWSKIKLEHSNSPCKLTTVLCSGVNAVACEGFLKILLSYISPEENQDARQILKEKIKPGIWIST